ncbi:hypothetical protein IID23_01875 [Patescibacteria group bacterium]|nr:hypothetical protein [Patescibacteria group bacterium]
MPEEIQQSVPQPQVTTSNKTSWKKIGLTVIIILVATGLIAGVYWFFVLNKSSDTSDLTGPVPKPNVTTATPSATPSTQKDETADWKVFLNDFHKYSIKTPPNWISTDAPSGGTSRPIWIFLNEKDFEKSKKSIEGISLISIIVVGLEGELGKPIGEATPIIIDREKGLKYYQSPCKPYDYCTTVQVTHKSNTYEFKLSAHGSRKSEEVFIKTLSTFKFLD